MGHRMIRQGLIVSTVPLGAILDICPVVTAVDPASMQDHSLEVVLAGNRLLC